MSINQRRTLIILATAVAALLALFMGVFVGESLAQDNEVVTDEVSDTSDTTEPSETTDPETTSTTEPTTTEATTTEPATTEATTTASPDPAPTPDPDPEEPEASGCDAPHGQGSWTVDGPGDAVAVTDMAPFGGDCAGVTLAVDGDASDLSVVRQPVLNTTTVRFEGSGPLPGPIGNDFIDFEVIDGRITTAVVTHDAQGITLVLYHPSDVSAGLGSHVAVDGSAVTVSVREQVGSDPAFAGPSYGGEPYHRTPRGPYWDGLFVDLAVDVEGSGTIVVQGYAKAPESHFEYQVFDTSDDSLVCDFSDVTEGLMWMYSKFTAECTPASPGTYDVVVGWPSLSDDPADAVWHMDEVTVG